MSRRSRRNHSTPRVRAAVRAVLVLVLLVAIVTGATSLAGCVGSSEVAVAEKVLPSVVAVRAYDAQTQLLGVGSGVIYKSDGIIVTNNHVVLAGGTEPTAGFTVAFASGKESQGTLVGRDPLSDLAVLKVG
jgi:putative serine protease PepD